MVAIQGHFDGKVIVPDVPVDLPKGRRYTFHVDPQESPPPGPVGVPGASLLRFAGAISLKDLDAMREAIEEGCERTDFNEW
jgi:hypothetical protein